MSSRPASLAFALLAAACAAPPPQGNPAASHAPSPQEVEWFHAGWYAGAAMGTAVADASAADLEDDLAGRGYDSDASLDDSEVGWKVFGGYRFDAPWAVEIALVDLGTVESEIATDAVVTDAFLDAVTDVHPYSGAGVSLSGLYFPIEEERFDVGLKAGAWFWQADVDVDAATGESLEVDEQGVHPLVGIVGLIDITDRWSARLEWEHYLLGSDNDVDFLAIGLQLTVR
ncbi:MAG: outer membrane beta-barrel protein [Planctomycetota bacterium]